MIIDHAHAITLILAAADPAGAAPLADSDAFIPPQVQGFISSALLWIGSTFCLLAAIGILRMPDVYTRMQAATKAGTLGVACIILGVAAHFGSLATAAEAFLIVAFLFLTAPVASHLIARAAYFVDVPKYKGTEVDEMEACYDDDSHELSAPAGFSGRHRPTLHSRPSPKRLAEKARERAADPDLDDPHTAEA
ncbi:MAG: monovalent cation/H(+) antiporter subunit G [Phycisphaerales bacterium]